MERTRWRLLPARLPKLCSRERFQFGHTNIELVDKFLGLDSASLSTHARNRKQRRYIAHRHSERISMLIADLVKPATFRTIETDKSRHRALLPKVISGVIPTTWSIARVVPVSVRDNNAFGSALR